VVVVVVMNVYIKSRSRQASLDVFGGGNEYCSGSRSGPGFRRRQKARRIEKQYGENLAAAEARETSLAYSRSSVESVAAFDEEEIPIELIEGT